MTDIVTPTDRPSKAKPKLLTDNAILQEDGEAIPIPRPDQGNMLLCAGFKEQCLIRLILFSISMNQGVF